MEYSADQIAGLVDLFGALPRQSLVQAIEELAFRQGVDLDAATVQDRIDDALSSYTLVEVDLEDETVLAPGPTAFPELPAGAEDLPHILDQDRRQVPREAIESTVRTRLAGSAATLEDADRAAELIDITYDAEAWAGLDLADVRTRLEAIVEDPGT